MLGGAFQRRHQVLLVDIQRAGGERRFSDERDAERIERIIDCDKGGALCALAELGIWGLLAFRQAVDTIVEQDDRQVDVAAHRMQKVVATDAETVTVAGYDEDLEVAARRLEAGGDRWRAAVDAVEPVRVHVVRQAAVATDA